MHKLKNPFHPVSTLVAALAGLMASMPKRSVQCSETPCSDTCEARQHSKLRFNSGMFHVLIVVEWTVQKLLRGGLYYTPDTYNGWNFRFVSKLIAAQKYVPS